MCNMQQLHVQSGNSTSSLHDFSRRQLGYMLWPAGEQTEKPHVNTQQILLQAWAAVHFHSRFADD